MNNKRGILFLIIILIYFPTSIWSQNGIPSSGGDFSGTGGSVSFSIGQLFFNTYSGSNGTLSEGVQQPYEISVVIGIEEAYGITLDFLAFPNPTHDALTVKVNNYNTTDLSYQLFDIKGNIIEFKEINENDAIIYMGLYTPGIYFVRVLCKNSEIKLFKIIKN